MPNVKDCPGFETFGADVQQAREAVKMSRRELAEKKKALYGEYRKAQREMREAVAVKTNIDHLLGVTGGRENKAQER